MSTDLVYQVLMAVGTGGAIYGGIRADLRAMREQIAQASQSAAKAHERLDNHIDKGN